MKSSGEIDKRKMNVLFVNPGYKPYVGGTERIVEQLARQYQQMDCIDRVGVLTTFMNFNESPPQEMRSLPSREIIDGVEVYRLHFRPQRLRYFYSLPAGLISWKVRDVVKEFRPDIVHFLLCEWFVANAWVYMMTRKTSRHAFHAAYHEPPAKCRFMPMKLANSFLGRVVDVVHASSDHVKKRLTEEYSIPDDKIHVVPLGPTVLEKSEKAVDKSSNGILTMLAVGRLAPDKGQLELVRLFDRARSRFNKPVRLVLAGGDGGHRDPVDEYIRENCLEDLIETTGFVSEQELDSLYRDADVFVLLTRVESFGLVFAEAQSYGLPVIGYGIEALKAVFNIGSTLVEPFNGKHIESAMEKLVNDDGLREELGAEALEHSRRFSWQKTAERLVGLYQSAVKG